MKRITELERKYVNEVLDNEFQTSLNNVYNSKLEKKFSEVFNVKYSIGHVNGTQTLHTALHSLGVGADDEVIVPPLTMSSTSLAVLQNRSIPVFADVDIKTFNISAESIREKITEKTKAIITVALYGLPPDYDEILKICKEHNLYLIEDNAECYLGEYNGKIAGQFGDFASYSFQASKHITSGEGGMLITNEPELADKARRFSSLGYAGIKSTVGKISKKDIQDPNYSRHIELGYNYRMSELNAAVALGQLERIDELVQNRIAVAKLFDEAICENDFLIKQETPSKSKNSYWAYSFILKTEKPSIDWYKFRDIFLKNGGDGFYAAWKLTYNEPLFQNEIQKQENVWQKYGSNLCPNAEYLQPRMIQMKTNYWNLEEAEKQAEILKKTINEFK